MKFYFRGQSFLEVLVAVGLGAIFFIGAATLIAPTLRLNKQTAQVQTAAALAKELLDNVRVFSEGDWHKISNLATSSANNYYLVASSSPFAAASGIESLVVGTTTYTRSFYLSDAYRDGSGYPTIISAGNTYDPSTKQVTVLYNWTNGATSSVVFYLTRNRSKIYFQNNWSGGAGQAGPLATTNSRYASSTGIVTNAQGSILASFPPGTSGTGVLDSTTFDTGAAQGAQFNAMTWLGAQVSGSLVQFQFAASSTPAGPWNFTGPDGTANTYYTPSGPGSGAAALAIGAFNNLRYFRYRVFIGYSALNGSSIVNAVVVNWSP